MKCPYCGKNNLHKHRYCIGCGEDLYPGQKLVPAQEEAAAKESPKFIPPPPHVSLPPKMSAAELQQPKKPVSADDFFGKQTLRPVDRKRGKMDVVSTGAVADAEREEARRIADEEAEQALLRFKQAKASMKRTAEVSAEDLPAYERRESHVHMSDSAGSASKDLESGSAGYRRRTEMRGVGLDDMDLSNLTQASKPKKQVTMSDDLRPVDPFPKKRASDFDEEELPAFIRARMKHKIEFSSL